MIGEEKGAVLITGASTGIGKVCALVLDRSGYRVFAGMRNTQGYESLRNEASELLSPVRLDITDSEQIAGAVEAVEKDLGPDLGLTGLINNAGIVVAGPLEFLPLDSLRRQLEVNVIGHVAVTQAFLPLIRKGRGRIVNISTAGCHFAVPFLGAYSASKIAMEALTDALRRELQPWGIPVLTVEPGVIETPIWEKSFAEADKLEAGLPIHAKRLYSERFAAGREFMEKLRRRAVPPKAVAEAVRRCLETRRPKTRYWVGTSARMLPFIVTFVPERFADWVVGKVLAI